MKETSATLLEFPELKQLLERFVQSCYGQRQLEKLEPSTDRAWLENELAVTSEAVAYLRRSEGGSGGLVPLRFTALPDCQHALARLRIEGTVLDGQELLDLAAVAARVAEIKRALRLCAHEFPHLGRYGNRLVDLGPLVSEIQAAILPDGTVSEAASPLLAQLRREIERARRRVQESLEHFLALYRGEGIVQEQFITIRNDRFVIPIVAGRQHAVRGVIHAASGTGHTLFVEPFETIELNNELVRLREEEAREAERVLRDLTERIRDASGSLAEAVELLGYLDLVFAKARFARQFDATVPRFSPAGRRRLYLREARHPLLEDVLRKQGRRPVPISLELNEDQRVLLISGPNAGGKTVALKTVGLLALMAQAALPVTAAEAEFPLFTQVLADIGDNQSIHESLSTFTAHISRVRQMLELACPDSLVLLDELGRATDPEEAGALGAAILEEFRLRGAICLASTHLLRIKVYGATTPGVLNAAVGFDEETLQPTYKLQLGVPGKSAGLEVAMRLGLPGPVIERARHLIDTSQLDIERLISDLHRRLEAVARMQAELDSRMKQLEAKELEFKEQSKRRLAREIEQLREQTRTVIQQFEERAQKVLEEIEQELAERRLAVAAQRRLARLKQELREQFEKEVAGLASPAMAHPRLEPGAVVRVRGVRQPARVLRLLKDGVVEVEAGLLKLQVSSEDVVEVLPPGSSVPETRPQVRLESDLGPRQLVREINVIGKRAEEACAEVDKFLDTAVLASVERVRIIHGHGMGILRRAIAELLANHPHVERFYPAPPEEGGAAVTVVELKA